MTKLRRHPILDVKKIKEFEKIIPRGSAYDVLGRELEDVILELEKSQNKVSKQLKKYVIIRLVTITETYIQNTVSNLIDTYDLDVTNLFQGTEIPIPIRNFKEIQKKDFTKGKIVAVNFNFQNFREINKVFSQLLGLNFFDALKEWITFGVNEKLISENEVHLLENWNQFQEMFSLRNDIVHTLRTPHKIRKNIDYYEKLWDTTWHFINCVYIFSEDIMAYKYGKIKDNKLAEFFQSRTQNWDKN